MLIALHARRSADSIDRFRLAHPKRPIVLVLTGTDVYRDIATDKSAQHSLAAATHLVCLQPRALDPLGDAARKKARVIVQSTQQVSRGLLPRDAVEFIAVGHLRVEKDPVTLMRATQRMPAAAVRVVHIGAALDEVLASEARATMRACPHYQWIGPLPHDETRRRIAAANALVHMSRLEGGANVVIEAICSGVPVLASDIDGNVGLLGDDYAGYFPVGDSAALSALMLRFASDGHFAQRLTDQCAALLPQYAPEVEAAAVRRLVLDCLPNVA